MVDLLCRGRGVVLDLESTTVMNWNDPHRPPQTGRPVLLWVRTNGLDWIGRGYYRQGYRLNRTLTSGHNQDEVFGWIAAFPEGDRPTRRPKIAKKPQWGLPGEDPRAITTKGLAKCPLCKICFEENPTIMPW